VDLRLPDAAAADRILDALRPVCANVTELGRYAAHSLSYPQGI
jgi:prephenate dehydratase